MATREQIVELYVGYFNRAPDPGGLNYWFEEIESGDMSLAEIAESFSKQPEAQELYPYLRFPEVVDPGDFLDQVYLNLFNRLPDQGGKDYWLGELEAGMPIGEAIVNIISGAKDDENGNDRTTLDNKVEAGFDWTVSVASVPGFQYETTDADGNRVVNEGAQAAARDVIADVTDDPATVDDAAAKTEAYVNAITSGDDSATAGDPIGLSVGADMAVGTSGNDTFIARVAQNDDGEQANQLGTGDLLFGSGGTDTLQAVIQKASALNASPASAIAMETNSVENIDLTALTIRNNDELLEVISDSDDYEEPEVGVNMKFTNSVDRIHSTDSDADLIVYNVNTLTESEVYADRRNTEDLTIRMDHTAGWTNFDEESGSNDERFDDDQDGFEEDASDLTVLFDQNYLIAGQAEEGFADFFLLDQDAELLRLNGEDQEGRLDKIGNNGISFSVDGVSYILQFDPRLLEEDNPNEVNTHEAFFAALEAVYLDQGTARQDLVDGLNAISPGAGDAALELLPPEGIVNLVFNDAVAGNAPYDSAIANPDTNIGGFVNQVPLADDTISDLIPAVTVESDTTQDVEALGFVSPPGAQPPFNVFGRVRDEGEALDLPITVNVELFKAGRGQDGGELVVGGMDTNGGNHLSDGGLGIAVFNVLVIGDDTQDSSIAELRSTNNELREIYIDNESGSTAGLEIGNSNSTNGGEGFSDHGIKDILILDSSAFENGLAVEAVFTDEIIPKYFDLGDSQFDADEDDALFQYNFGTGDDYLDAQLTDNNSLFSGSSNREDFDLQITMNDGDDMVELEVGTAFFDEGPVGLDWYINHVRDANDEASGATDNNDDATDNENGIDVDLGAGADRAYLWDASAVTVDAGNGDDVVFTDNSDAEATWVLNNIEALDGNNINGLISEDEVSVTRIANMQLEVSFLGITSTVEVGDSIQSTSGVTITDLTINQAIKDAINNDPVLSEILEASDGPGRTLVVESLVDGLMIEDDFSVRVLNSGALSQSQVNAGAQLFVDGSSDPAIGFDRDTGLPDATDRWDSEFGTFGGFTDITGDDSEDFNHNTVEGGLGSDLIALSSEGALDLEGFSTETVDIDDNFGDDILLNFKAAGFVDIETTTADLSSVYANPVDSTLTPGNGANGFDIFDVSDLLGNNPGRVYNDIDPGDGNDELDAGINYATDSVVIVGRVSASGETERETIERIANENDTVASNNQDMIVITVTDSGDGLLNTGTFWYADNGGGTGDVSVERLGSVKMGQYADQANKDLIGDWDDLTIDNFTARTQAELVDLIGLI